MHDAGARWPLFRITRSICIGLSVAAVILVACSAAEGDLAGYKPAHALGSGDGDWWIDNPGSGSTVDHPKWVLSSLKDRPVVIMDHTATCKSCLEQKTNMDKALQKYGGDLAYYDISADGSDFRADQTFEAYSLSPEGQYYVPTTVFITMIKNSDGTTSITWHSVEDAMSVDAIEAYMKDAIYYYRESKEGSDKES